MLRLTLDALQVLDAIARLGSFASAAQALHRTPSTLSYTVKKLEDDLGVTVFDRSGHKAVLTQAGRLLLDEGRAVLDAAGAIERRVRAVGQGWEAELVLAVNELVPLPALLAVLDAFYAAGHPTRLRITTEVLGGAWDALVTQRADVALAEVPAASPGLEVTHRPVGTVPHVFCCAPSHPLARAQQPLKASDIRRHRVVVAADSARQGAPRSSGIASAADVLTVDSIGAKLQAQVAGLGVGFLPVHVADPAIAAGQLLACRVAVPKPRTAISVAWRAQDAGPAVLWFAERLQQLPLR